MAGIRPDTGYPVSRIFGASPVQTWQWYVGSVYTLYVCCFDWANIYTRSYCRYCICIQFLLGDGILVLCLYNVHSSVRQRYIGTMFVNCSDWATEYNVGIMSEYCSNWATVYRHYVSLYTIPVGHWYNCRYCVCILFRLGNGMCIGNRYNV